ncbi:trans-aconitate 2-methyltransferase [Williamsia sp. CHRR-6]|uniref:trans-aconitate 2-methyltransferase n=1 Tax=Williamsia sp. CHRR-6 TaxID=2835871 RepID=UPI001BDA924F|nr:trans-aconitate 2-methyltransferase [Williamsia sp. CHRR-6]MBT0566984.1 trans-aconitate 2-methyltransferase [Williamsia sp. CHRR-6]
MWSPDQYLTYAALRGRPYWELLSRIGCDDPRRIVDLGCGPGNLTEHLASRWPNAIIEAIDSSAEMVTAARARGVHAQVQDVRDWHPTPGTDIVISNATLQWVSDHRDLLTRWPTELHVGSWMAIQVPGNFDAPSHRIIRALAESPMWRPQLGGLLRGPETVDDPTGYARLLEAVGCVVDAWETTYLQSLTGPDPVLEWVTGTALTPVRDVLDDDDWDRFRRDLAPRLRAAYPPAIDGRTHFPFRRVFAVAQVR